jgi:hypothetical protein
MLKEIFLKNLGNGSERFTQLAISDCSRQAQRHI